MKNALIQIKLFTKACRLGALAVGVGLLAMSSTVSAQAFPSRAITIIVPYSPGGGTDALARIVAQGLQENIGQSVIIVNKPGAGGTIGASAAAHAAPDGYTLLILNALPHTSSAGLYAKLPYDPVKSFTGIGTVAVTPYVLVAGPSVSAKTFTEFVQLARSKPGAINYASSGIGGVSHLSTELFNSMAKISLKHVPYKGDGPAITDLLGGYVDVTFGNVLAMAPHIASGKLRALAVTSAERSTAFPGVPTVAESGYPDFVVVGEFGLAAPAGVPKDVIAKLSAALIKTVNSPKIAEQLKQQGVDPKASTPEEFDALMRVESKKWLGVIHEIGIQAQ